MRNTIIAAALAIGAVAGVMPTASAVAPGVDYRKFASCSYSATDPGWAQVGRAPKGTASVVFTMRTGTPGAWGAVSVTSTNKARRWRVTTPSGTSFINYVTFLDSSQNELAKQMVNIRCSGTPLEWPA